MGFITNTSSVLYACVFFIASLQYIRWRQQVESISQVDQRAHGGDVGQRGLLNNTNNNYNKILHVISPFKPSKCNEPFCPFDQTRSIVIASMIRAKKKARSPVTLAAAVFPEDRDAIPPEFVLLPSLKRDTLTEYPKIPNMRKLPFVQEILDLVLNSPFSFEYFIFTNSDIVLHEDFYNIVQKQIERGYDAFSINRQEIFRSRKIADGSAKLYTALDLDEIFKIKRLKGHKGHDCFIMKKEILSQIKMGDVFMGAPPVARAFIMQIDRLATKGGKHFHSDELKATYHLGRGNEGGWARAKGFKHQNAMNTFCTIPHLMNKCIESESSYCKDLLVSIRKDWRRDAQFHNREMVCKGFKSVI